MIKIVHGDLLQATEQIIGHQVNCQGEMNSGVALQIKEQFPDAYEAYVEDVYKQTLERDDREKLLGRVQAVVCGDKIIAHMFAQLNYGYDGEKYTNTDALATCLEKLANFAKNNEFSVALPYLVASDRGGADWKVVEGLIIDAFKDYEVTLYKKD